jgi:quercetin dioxygenase-like cupin family protein
MSAQPISKPPLCENPAIVVAESDTPWVPFGDGQWFRLLRVLSNYSGYVAQLKLNVGAVIPPHRHTGTVHALNIQGSRRLHSGETIRPGDFAFEPAGNVDTWQAVGDEPLIVHIQVEGDVEYLDQRGGVASRSNAQLLESAYHRYCAAVGIAVKHLGGNSLA